MHRLGVGFVFSRFLCLLPTFTSIASTPHILSFLQNLQLAPASSVGTFPYTCLKGGTAAKRGKQQQRLVG
jgi:hypothetical protein